MNETTLIFTQHDIGGIRYLHKNMAYLLPYVVLYSATTVFGILGNFLIISTIITVKELHTTANLLIFNLAIIDFFICSFVGSFTVAAVLLGMEFFNKHIHLCHFIAAFCLLLCVGSMVNIGLLAINRYVHICHHKLYEKIFNKRNTILICIGVWVFGMLIDLPNILGWGGHIYDSKSLACVWDRLAAHSYSIFFSSSCILVPSACIFVCYLRIYHFVITSKNRVSSIPNDTNHKLERKASIRLAKSLFGSFLLFVICWIPYGMIVMIDFHDKLPAWVHAFSTFLAHANSSFNSLLYAKFNPLFLKSYKKCMNKLTFGKVFKENSITKKKRKKLNGIV